MRGLKKRAPKTANEKGQVSIFIGSMLLTFFLFLAFVINTGMIVNAKINLQNAADLAAYAGAAVQARQLNDIGYLNYEMRRVFKKFLFRYYVVGNSTQPTFPKGNGGPTSGAARFGVTEFVPGGSNSIKDLGVPSTCVTFLPNDNFCAIRNLPPIPRPAGGAINSLDAIMGALDQQLTTLEGIRKEGCVGIGQMNQMLMLYWLWNTDPNLDAVVAALSGAGNTTTYAERLKVLRSLSAGLGLIPREIFLRKRIDSLNRYVNFAPQKKVDVRKVNALKAGSDWAMHERTIQAYLSAYHTLGEGTFSEPASITMDEILPEGSGGADLLKLNDVNVEFDAFATDFAIDNKDPCQPFTVDKPASADRNAGCVQCLVSYPQSEKLTGFKPVVGVAKDPKIMTYYAIRLQAKAKLLFNPYAEDLTLSAYAAAQPFGSRIGPSLTEAFFNSPGAPSGAVNSRCTNTTCFGSVPNIPVKETDAASPTLDSGWGQNDVLFNFYSAGFGIVPGNGAVQQSIGTTELLKAYHVAMAPNPWEKGRYLIPADANDDPFVSNYNSAGVHAIWAPLFTGNSGAANANPADEIIGYINKMAQSYTTLTNAGQSIFSPAAQGALISQINAYVNNFLKQGKGEDGEGINVVRIFDPISTRVDLVGRRDPIAPAIPDTIIMRDAKRLKTGWNDVLFSDYKSKGRAGYSVKFVPLNLLRNASGVTTNGSDSFANRLPTADGVGNDIPEMKH